MSLNGKAERKAVPRSASGREIDPKGGEKLGKINVDSFSSAKLKNKEAQYRKVNAKLESKTASLVKEAEDLMQEHSTTFGNEHEDQSLLKEHTVSSFKDNEGVKGNGGQEGILTKAISVDIEKTVRELEEKLEKEELLNATLIPNSEQRQEQVIPLVAEELGNEAMLRFMKAKLRLMQEEIEKLTQTNQVLEKKCQSSVDEVKALTECNKKLEKTQQSLKSNAMKYNDLMKEYQSKCESLEVQIVALKRELDCEKASQKKFATRHGSTEVRLNRALEEVEKYKNLYQKFKQDAKDTGKCDKHKLAILEADNKTLVKQKKELLAAFQKQMKLIDILKRQKIHLEAARMLAFAEEEFVKVLDLDTA